MPLRLVFFQLSATNASITVWSHCVSRTDKLWPVGQLGRRKLKHSLFSFLGDLGEPRELD